MAQKEKLTGSNRQSIPPGKSDLGLSPYSDDIGTMDINFGGKSPISYLQFLVGAEIFDIFGDKMLNEAFERAYFEVLNLIRDDVILDNVTASGGRFHTTDNTIYGASRFIDMYPKRILKVARKNHADEDTTADEQYYYDARKIIDKVHGAENKNSLYYENDPFNPCWYIDSTGGMNILPKNGGSAPAGKIWYITFPIFGVGIDISSHVTHDLGEQSGIQNFSIVDSTRESEIFIGIPKDVRNAVYIGMAVNLVDGFLSNHVQDEEDIELVNLLKSQSEWLLFNQAKVSNLVKVKYGDGVPVESGK